MTFVGSRHFCFQGVLLQKIFKVLFYYSVGIKMNIIQARLYSFFSFNRNKNIFMGL